MNGPELERVNMTWRWARGFAAGGLQVHADDLSRVVDDDRGTAIVLANASDAPFEIVAPSISSGMLDAAIAAWKAGGSPVDAIEQARAALVAQGGDAMGWMLFGSLASDVDIAWVGLDEARQVVGTTIVTRTMPHSLRAMAGPTSPDVATRHLDRSPCAPDSVHWQPRAGARLVFANHAVARVEFATAAAAVGISDLQDAATKLAEEAVRAQASHPAVVVLVERG